MSGNGKWERISKPEDFPHVVVSAYHGESGPAFAVAFWNLEFLTGWRAWRRVLIIAVLIVTPVPALIGTGMLEKQFGWPAIVAVLIVFVVGGVWLGGMLKNPNNVWRSIILDIGEDHFRVAKSGKTVFKRSPISSFAPPYLTVEDHPDAEYKRTIRAQRGEKPLYPEEKQHCLYGYFGARGAEKVLLLCRAEWPSQYSLREVQQAVMWIMEEAGPEWLEATRAREEPPLPFRPAGEGEEAPEPAKQQGGGGINPPLD